MKKLCVIGWPVRHSKSPILHNAMLGALGLPYEYGIVPVEPGHLEEFLAFAKENHYAGFNATMPFKEALLPFLDEIDPLAKKLGAVNTVCIKNDKLYGYNTDCPGYAAALRQEGFQIAGKTALILGAGGAAKAVALGLCQAGAKRVLLANRTAEKARQAAALCPEVCQAVSWDRQSLCSAAENAELLVNGTSLGMAGQGEFESFEFLAALPENAWVSDLIYHPAQTELLRRAAALGHRTMNGLPLLVHQGILALEHFTDTPLDPGEMVPVILNALEETP